MPRRSAIARAFEQIAAAQEKALQDLETADIGETVKIG